MADAPQHGGDIVPEGTTWATHNPLLEDPQVLEAVMRTRLRFLAKADMVDAQGRTAIALTINLLRKEPSEDEVPITSLQIVFSLN